MVSRFSKLAMLWRIREAEPPQHCTFGILSPMLFSCRRAALTWSQPCCSVF